MKIISKAVLSPVLSTLLLCVVILSATCAGSTDESKLRNSIHLINNARYDEALPILKELSEANPADTRVLNSLGLVYRCKGYYKDAIGMFERSVQIKPAKKAYYSLGLLYEALAVDPAEKQNEVAWLTKAEQAWNSFMKMKPRDPNRIAVAKRHWDDIKQQLKEHSAK